MRILIVSDAWHPQINGVVRTLEATQKCLEAAGHTVTLIGPDQERLLTVAAPTYADIRLEFLSEKRLLDAVRATKPDTIHIATEGPMGWAMRTLCLLHRWPFTTSYHTRFPEYLAARVPAFWAPLVRWGAYRVLRHFHAPSKAVMVATPSIAAELTAHKFKNIAAWSRGVDTHLFRPYGKDLEAYSTLPRPLLLYVGRISVEKNLRAFLDLATTGSKIVIGSGPDEALLADAYPDAHFLGPFTGEELARAYAAADLFVFPSTTDTFGLVLLEACAAGLRIASYPASGPVDLFTTPEAQSFAVLDTDLQKAVDTALALPDNPEIPRTFAQRYAWETCTEAFATHLASARIRTVQPFTRLGRWLRISWLRRKGYGQRWLENEWRKLTAPLAQNPRLRPLLEKTKRRNRGNT